MDFCTRSQTLTTEQVYTNRYFLIDMPKRGKIHCPSNNLIKQNMLCMLNVFLCITHLFLSPILMYYLLYMQQMQ